MKAVIMAGGEGSRLRPLTCDIPKPMARLCGRPILEYILDLLAGHGITQAALTVRYLPGRISGHFPTGEYGGLRLAFAEEEKPLGTAGSVKNACTGEEDAVLVISGDALCDFDLTAAMDFHKEKGADVTIVGKRVADPREYGLVDAGEGGEIRGFIEKPAFTQAVSDMANTGIYILSKSALELIPQDENFDFAKNLFPLMLQKGMGLFCWEGQGYWCDIGDLASYTACQRDMLEGRVRCRIDGERLADGTVLAGDPLPADCRVKGPVYIGRNVKIEGGARLEAGTVVDDGCYIGMGARLTGSVLLPDAYVGPRARLTGALVCAGAAVKAGAMLFEGSALGASAIIGERASLLPGVKVWNGKKIPPSVEVAEHVKIGDAARGYFDEYGITGEIGVELTPEFCARIGSAVGSLDPKARIAVGASNHPSARVLKSALAAGIQATGAGVLDFGENFQAMFEFSMNFCASPLGVFIRGGNRAGLKIMTAGGLPANREIERSIEGILARGEFVRCAYDQMGDQVEMAGMDALYRAQLIRNAPKGLTGCAARVSSHNLTVQNLLRETLSKMGCDVENGFLIEVSSQGDKLRLYDEEYGHIPHDKILTICAQGELARGNDIALPFDAPHLLDDLAGKMGRRVLRYFDCPADQADQAARNTARCQMWSRDGLMQAVMLMDLIKRSGGLEVLLGRTPGFERTERTLQTKGNPARLLRSLGREKGGPITEGVMVEDTRGVVLVRPLKRGEGIRILAEAHSAEVARELCVDMERRMGLEVEP